MKVLITLFGMAVLTDGAVLSLFSNYNLGIVLTMSVGMFFIAIGYNYDRIKAVPKRGVLGAIKRFVLLCICAEFMLVGFVFIYGQHDTVTYDEDAIVVLGAAVRGSVPGEPLKKRLDKAIEIYRENADVVIVVTGGKGEGEFVTEASAMEEYLLENGVHHKAIIKEENATSTEENLRFSRQILDEHFDRPYNTVIVTNRFHIYRSIMLAKQVGFKNVTHGHAGLKLYNSPPCYLRESLAIFKLWLIDLHR